MKSQLFGCVVMAALLLAPAPDALAAGGRPGLIVTIVPIKNKGEDETRQVKTRRKIGNVLGGLAGQVGGVLGVHSDNFIVQQGAIAAAGVAPKAGEELLVRAGGDGPTTRYMVKVKLDSGKTLSITQMAAQVKGLEAGERVRVEGKGDDALVFSE